MINKVNKLHIGDNYVIEYTDAGITSVTCNLESECAVFAEAMLTPNKSDFIYQLMSAVVDATKEIQALKVENEHIRQTSVSHDTVKILLDKINELKYMATNVCNHTAQGGDHK